MMSFKAFGIYVILMFTIFAVAFAAECKDEEDGHCEVLSQFCEDKQWAHLTAKCLKTCGKC